MEKTITNFAHTINNLGHTINFYYQNHSNPKVHTTSSVVNANGSVYRV